MLIRPEAHGAAAMNHKQSVHLFWPVGLSDYLNAHTSIHILVGICFHAKHAQCGDTTIAAVLGVSKLDQDLQTLQQLLQDSNKHTTTSSQQFSAATAALGCWANTGAEAASVVAPERQELWLSLHGKQQLQQAMQLGGLSRDKKQLIAPNILWQQCRFPQGTGHVQVFLYEPPAGECSSHAQALRLEQQQQPPWMLREPGIISLAFILHTLQQAHRNIQQQQQQQLFLQGSSSNITSGEHAHWCHLADLLSWPNSSRQHSTVKLLQVLGNLQENSLQCCRLRLNCLRLQKHGQADRSNTAACSSHSSSGSSGMTVLPGLLQHLLGLAAAWLLLRHRQELVLHAAAAGAWLQQDVLQPHIEWLMQARPGGIKLHQELSFLLGSAASTALDLAAAFYTATWPHLGPAALLALAAAAAVGGAVAACVAAARMLLLLAWPLEAVYGAVAALHRIQLKCLAATWRLIRGKQKVRRFSERWRQREQQQAAAKAAASNPAAASTSAATATATTTAEAVTPAPPAAATTASPSASATDEVSVEQLIVGVLLFTPLLGLFPTTAAWYLSVCCCHGALLLLRLALLGFARLLRLQAMYLLIRRWTSPQSFPRNMMVQLLQQQQQQQQQQQLAERSSSGGNRIGSRVPDYHEAETDAATTCATRAVSAAGCGMQGVAVSYYHMFNDPQGYAEVLWQCWALQRVAGHNGEHKSLLGLVTIMTGNWWGLALDGS